VKKRGEEKVEKKFLISRVVYWLEILGPGNTPPHCLVPPLYPLAVAAQQLLLYLGEEGASNQISYTQKDPEKIIF
jgi:hypothetical protein